MSSPSLFLPMANGSSLVPKTAPSNSGASRLVKLNSCFKDTRTASSRSIWPRRVIIWRVGVGTAWRGYGSMRRSRRGRSAKRERSKRSRIADRGSLGTAVAQGGHVGRIRSCRYRRISYKCCDARKTRTGTYMICLRSEGARQEAEGRTLAGPK